MNVIENEFKKCSAFKISSTVISFAAKSVLRDLVLLPQGILLNRPHDKCIKKPPFVINEGIINEKQEKPDSAPVFLAS